MKKLSLALLTAGLLSASSAQAALINFTGTIDNHNDVISTYFTLDSAAADVRVWTDSFLDGVNFDPITALWNADTGALISENDDNRAINPSTQTRFDSGFYLPTLDAGNYVFTVGTYNNFASGNNLSDGFDFDNQTAIPLEIWDQPFNSIDMGPNWSVWLDGVDSASNPDANPVPAPASLAIFALGIFGMVARRRLQK